MGFLGNPEYNQSLNNSSRMKETRILENLNVEVLPKMPISQKTADRVPTYTEKRGFWRHPNSVITKTKQKTIRSPQKVKSKIWLQIPSFGNLNQPQPKEYKNKSNLSWPNPQIAKTQYPIRITDRNSRSKTQKESVSSTEFINQKENKSRKRRQN